MKRPLTYIVICLFSLQLGGYYSFYFFKNIQLHIDPLERLKYGTAEQLTLSRNTFENALIDEREMKVDGAMFDIIKSVRKGDSVTVWGFRDREEEALSNLLSKIVLSESQKDQPDDVVNIVFHLQYLPSENQVAMTICGTSIRINATYKTSCIPFLIAPLTPPPWQCVTLS